MMGKSLCVIVLLDLNTIVTLLAVFDARCPLLGINLKSSLWAQLNLMTEWELFLKEKVILFYSPMMQSSKLTLSSSSFGKF